MLTYCPTARLERSVTLSYLARRKRDAEEQVMCDWVPSVLYGAIFVMPVLVAKNVRDFESLYTIFHHSRMSYIFF